MSRKYSILYADPAWRYQDKCTSGKRGVDYKYATMSDSDILDMGELIEPIMEDDSTLWLWATAPRLPFCLDVMNAWGFSYKTVGFNWMKRNKIADTWFMGMGNWSRSNSEFCLLGTRGKPKRVCANVRSTVDAHILGHSAKPPEVRERIVTLMGNVPRLELFARSCGEGWDATGLEYDGKDVFDFLREIQP